MKSFKMCVAVLVLCGLTSVSHASGIKVEVQKGSSLVTLFNSPTLFNQLTSLWSSHRTQLDREIERLMGSLNPKLPRGVNFARQHVNLANATITTRVDVGQGLAPVRSMQIIVEAKHNVVTSRFTTPTVFGSYADPEFKLTFDVRGVITIPVNERARRLSVTMAKFEIRNVHITPENATARVIDFAASVYHVFGGTDLKRMAEQAMTKQVNLAGTVNNMLAPVNSKLASIPAGAHLKLYSQNGFLIRIVDFPAPPSTPVVLH